MEYPSLPDDTVLCERIIEILLQVGAEVNVAPRPLGTPPHVSTYLREVSLLKLLLDHGADTNATGGHFGSALITAMIKGRQTVINFLLVNGINVNIRSGGFGTAFHYACAYEDGNTVKTLLEHNADVGSVCEGIGSPLAAIFSEYTVQGRGPGEIAKKSKETLKMCWMWFSCVGMDYESQAQILTWRRKYHFTSSGHRKKRHCFFYWSIVEMLQQHFSRHTANPA